MRHAKCNPISLFFGYIFELLKNLFTTHDNRVNEETTNCLIDATRIDNGQPNEPTNNIALSEEQHKEVEKMTTAGAAIKATAHSADLQKLVNAAVDTAAMNIHRIICEYHNRALKMRQIPATIEYRYRGLYAIEIIQKPFGQHDTECIFSDKEMERLVPDFDSPVSREFDKMFRDTLGKRLVARQNFMAMPKHEKQPPVWAKIEHPFREYVEVISKTAANTLFGNICDLTQQYYMDAVTDEEHVSEHFSVQYFPNGNMIRISTDTFTEHVDYWYQIRGFVPESFITKKAFAGMMRSHLGKNMLVGDLKVSKNILYTELFVSMVHEELCKKLLNAGFTAQNIDGHVKYLFTATPRANIGLQCTPNSEATVTGNPEVESEEFTGLTPST